MAQFERLIAPSEQDVAGRLKTYIADVQDNPQQVIKHISSILNFTILSGYLLMRELMCPFQLLQVFQKHKELIRRPTISKELQSERETLLAKLLDYNKGTHVSIPKH